MRKFLGVLLGVLLSSGIASAQVGGTVTYNPGTSGVVNMPALLNLPLVGTISGPSLSFGTCGANCGIWAPAAGEIEVSILGVNRLDYGVTNASAWNFGSTVQLNNNALSSIGNMFFNSGSLLQSTVGQTFQFGGSGASPSGQTLTVASVSAGNSNVNGANTTVVGSLSTGSGVSGDIIIRTGGTGAAATVQNSPATALTLKGATQQANFAGQINVSAMTQTAVAQSGTVCYNSGTGTITYDATLGCLTSSARFKEGIASLLPQSSLSTVMKLDPVAFDYKPNMALPEGRQVGFLAEQVASVDERLIARGDDGSPRGVRYAQMTAVLTGAIQELKADNDNLRACVESWKCRIFGWRGE